MTNCTHTEAQRAVAAETVCTACLMDQVARLFREKMELVEALQGIVAAGSPSPYAAPKFEQRLEAARAAIAKATGATP